MKCHTNDCSTDIATHNKRLQRGLVVEEKYLRAANYARNMNKEIDMIAHSCGLQHARKLRREHVRIVETAGKSVALNIIYPYPEAQQSLSDYSGYGNEIYLRLRAFQKPAVLRRYA